MTTINKLAEECADLAAAERADVVEHDHVLELLARHLAEPSDETPLRKVARELLTLIDEAPSQLAMFFGDRAVQLLDALRELLAAQPVVQERE